MTKVIAVSVAILIVAISIGIVSVNGASASHGNEKVPLITVDSIYFGNAKFGMTEKFDLHNSTVERNRSTDVSTVSIINNLGSAIGDHISSNFSVSISNGSISLGLLSPSGSNTIYNPAGHSYATSLYLSGNTSFNYVTIAETVPFSSFRLSNNSSWVSGVNEQLAFSSLYNLSLEYENDSFDLLSPGFVSVDGNITQVALAIYDANGSSSIRLSFPVSDGNFSFRYDQVLSSSNDVNPYVANYYSLSGSPNRAIGKVLSNSYSFLIGAAIFVLVLTAIFLYYRRK